MLIFCGVLLISGCGQDAGEESEEASTPPAEQKNPEIDPVTVKFTTSEGFRYRFDATQSSFNATGDPAEPVEPAVPGSTYVVVKGTLRNLLTDRPALMYPGPLSTGDHLSVTAARNDVRQAVPADKGIGTENCDQLTFFFGMNALDAANRSDICLFTLWPSIIDAVDDATIPEGGSAEVTYTALVPDKLPRNGMRLAVSTYTGKTTSPGTTFSQEKGLPWTD
ncbi:hypothetical protein [Streptomyces albicerus]|uniref:hypothetical protein n=1 Tax=Streptomyces albicerus TaxID=2569859 RepID=UPI00124B54FA|nr:hypothetical protein [Streptomyces albicerus]